MKKVKEVRWEILETKELFRADPRLVVTVQKIRLPDGRIVDDYYQVEYPEAVIIAAVTKDKKVVMSRQYQHGLGHVTTVLPAGTVPKGEDRLETAKRELLEEAGYESGDWSLLSQSSSHLNHRGSKVTIYLAKDAVKTAEPQSGDLEEMEIMLLSEEQILEAIKNNEIKSLGTVTGLVLAGLRLQEDK